MQDSGGQNFRTKDGRQVALTGCSRRLETRTQWTDIRAAADHIDENIGQMNNMVLSQEHQPRTHSTPVVRIIQNMMHF